MASWRWLWFLRPKLLWAAGLIQGSASHRRRLLRCTGMSRPLPGLQSSPCSCSGRQAQAVPRMPVQGPQQWTRKGFPRSSVHRSRVPRLRRECRAALPAVQTVLSAFDPAGASRSIAQASSVLAAALPVQLRPVISTLGADLASVVRLKPTISGAGHLAVCPAAAPPRTLQASHPSGSGVCPLLQAVWYLFFSTPSPFYGVADFYLFDPLGRLLQRKWKTSMLTLRNRMGSGNYGQARRQTACKRVACHHAYPRVPSTPPC